MAVRRRALRRAPQRARPDGPVRSARRHCRPGDAHPRHAVNGVYRPHPGDRPGQSRSARRRFPRDARSFKEGAEVKKGDLLYRLEQGPFQADVEAKEAVVDQYKAQLENAQLTLARGKALLNTPAGQQSTVDAALANQLSIKAQMMAAEAQLAQSQDQSRLHRHPRADRRQDRPHRRDSRQLRHAGHGRADDRSSARIRCMSCSRSRRARRWRCATNAAAKGGVGALVVKVRLPDGSLYNQTGKLDFLDNTVAASTDTIILRAVIPNPVVTRASDDLPARQLVDGELITAIVEDAQPVEALAIPRAGGAHRSGGRLCVCRRRRQQGRSSAASSSANSSPAPQLAVVTNGLKEGENVVVEGIQRVRPGQPRRASSRSAADARPDAADAKREHDNDFRALRPAAPARHRHRHRHHFGGPDRAHSASRWRNFPTSCRRRVQVTANYPGASAAVVEASVAQPLEAQIVGVDKMIYMKSTSGNDGSYNLTVSFAAGHQSRHRHRQRQQPRADRAGAACRKKCSCRASRSSSARPRCCGS